MIVRFDDDAADESITPGEQSERARERDLRRRYRRERRSSTPVPVLQVLSAIGRPPSRAPRASREQLQEIKATLELLQHVLERLQPDRAQLIARASANAVRLYQRHQLDAAGALRLLDRLVAFAQLGGVTP